MARRLCSGSLLQFLTREEFFENDIPSLGYYRHTEYILQNYSCAGSPFIMFIPFIALALPDDSPFWTAKENEGFWETLGNPNQKLKFLIILVLFLLIMAKQVHPKLFLVKFIIKIQIIQNLYTIHIFHGKITIRKVELQWNTAFRSLDPRDLRGDDINFYLTGHKLQNSSEKNAVYTTSESMLYNGVRKDVIYRQAIMRKPPNNGVGYIIDLAEIIIPGGIIRVDRYTLWHLNMNLH